MSNIRNLLLVACLLFAIPSMEAFAQSKEIANDSVVSYIVDVKNQTLKLYWKDENQVPFLSLGKLKDWLNKKHQVLLFAMNGGMYKEDRSPLGLFVENHKIVTPLNTTNGYGNFYLQPNGVLYLTKDSLAGICLRTAYKHQRNIKYATQSGPMLVIDGHIHPAFNKGSSNVNIRNGVGILPDNKLIFAMSKKEISLYDFAQYFKSKGCKNALYLDGFVSRTYLPSANWIQTDGNFGVIIGVTATAKPQ